MQDLILIKCIFDSGSNFIFINRIWGYKHIIYSLCGINLLKYHFPYCYVWLICEKTNFLLKEIYNYFIYLNRTWFWILWAFGAMNLVLAICFRNKIESLLRQLLKMYENQYLYLFQFYWLFGLHLYCEQHIIADLHNHFQESLFRQVRNRWWQEISS